MVRRERESRPRNKLADDPSFLAVDQLLLTAIGVVNEPIVVEAEKDAASVA